MDLVDFSLLFNPCLQVFKISKSKECYQVAMSTDAFKEKPKFIPDSSQGDYWGGHMMSFSTFRFVTILLGLFGIDHLALRSPFTAFLKFLVNIFFYGAWWIYDIIQVFVDEENVAKYGLSTPWGPRGHGFRFFKGVTDKKINEYPNSSPIVNSTSTILYIFYALSTAYFSFLGLPSLFAGDYIGGVLKLISLAFIIPFPIYMFTGIYEYFTSGGIEKEGVPRTWPIVTILNNFIFHDPEDRYPAVNMLSPTEKENQMKVYRKHLEDYQGKQSTKKPFTTLWEAAYGWATGPLKVFELAGAASKTAEAGAQVTQTTAKAMNKIVEKDPEKLLPGASCPKPEENAEPNETTPLMKGGGLFQFSSPEESMSTGFDVLVMGGILTLILGGFVVAAFRKIPYPKRNTEDEYPRKTYDRDDAPPKPGAV